MLKFDPQKVKIEFVQLKSVTTALDGSMQIIDEKFSKGKKEVLKRVKVPLSVIRAFIMANKKVTKYLKPALTAVMTYEGHVVAMERHPLGSLGTLEDKSGGKWRPFIDLNYQRTIAPLLKVTTVSWYFDGRYVFRFKRGTDADEIARFGTPLTKDTKFRKCVAETYDLQNLYRAPRDFEMQERSCLAFVSSRGAQISPPIWKDLSNVGSKQRKAESDEDDEEIEDAAEEKQSAPNPFSFDEIDGMLSVNLNFALKAGVMIGKTFGYEFIEPLQLPRLMIELRTVNLPNVPQQVKATYDIHMKFTHALAWLLGLSRRADQLDTYIMMRSLMKYLTKKGVFRSNLFDASRVFVEGKAIADLKMVPLDDLLKDPNFTRRSYEGLFDDVREHKRRAKMLKDGNLTVGSFLNEEG